MRSFNDFFVLKIRRYYTIACLKSVFLSLNGKTGQKKKENTKPSAGWLKNYLNTIETTNTFEDRQSKPDIHQKIFKLKSAEKLKYSASAGKTNILMKKSVN